MEVSLFPVYRKGEKMQRTMSSEELYAYTSQIKNPSETFELFLHHYVTGDAFTRSRENEDVSVWDKLKGNELELAKQIIFDGLKITPDLSYMRAVSIIKDERAIPILKKIIETYPQRFIAEKLFAAKVLYDLTGYKDYIPMLEAACKNRDNEMLHSYLVYFIDQYIDGLTKNDTRRIMRALNYHESK